jgi:hypothetical protein
MSALERMYALEGPDEPDLCLNVSYLTSCRALGRLERAEPWEVPRHVADMIDAALARAAATRDPHVLAMQLLSLPVWVLRLLDRRGADRGSPGGPPSRSAPLPRRRSGDRLPAVT